MTDVTAIEELTPREYRLLHTGASLRMLDSIKVGYGARHFQNTIVGTGRQAVHIHSHLQLLFSGGIEFAILANHRSSHLGIAMNVRATEALCLDHSCLQHPFADCRRRLAISLAPEVIKGDRFNMTLDIYSVE